jgi:hypothetical protein
VVESEESSDVGPCLKREQGRNLVGPEKVSLGASTGTVVGLIVALGTATGGTLLFLKRPRRMTSTAASESALLESLEEFHRMTY